MTPQASPSTPLPWRSALLRVTAPVLIAWTLLLLLLAPTVADLGFSAGQRVLWDLGAHGVRWTALAHTLVLTCLIPPAGLRELAHSSTLSLAGLALAIAALTLVAWPLGAPPPPGLIGWSTGLTLQVLMVHALVRALRAALPAPSAALSGVTLIAIGLLPGLVRAIHSGPPPPLHLRAMIALLPDLDRLTLQHTLLYGESAPWLWLTLYALCWAGAGTLATRALLARWRP